MFDSEVELIEVCKTEENESEKEDNKKEKENRLQIDFYRANTDAFALCWSCLCTKEFESLHHPEVTTPPPESHFFLS